MKKINCFFGIILIGLMLLSTYAFAEDIYVTGITRITMRTGPGLEHKVIAMMTTGDKLEIVEYQKDWSRVKTARGKTGWVLSRFLSQKIPDALLNEKLEKVNLELASQLETIKEERETLKQENTKLLEIEEKYHELKQASAEFLKLDAEYKKMVQLNEAQKNQIKLLEEDLDSEPKLWFLIGPGVFIVGLFFGLSTRKKKKSGLL